MPDTYRCAGCGGWFKCGRTDEEAHAEAQVNYGKRGDAPGMVLVCDVCYKAVREMERHEQAKAIQSKA